MKYSTAEYSKTLTGDEEEVMRLARENSPRLLSKYKSTYPAFFKNLDAIYPGLQNSELTFCIYLRLGMSTKEIAMCTFVTPKAIQNRKNRIRKKLNIPSRGDIYQFFREVNQTS